MADRCSPFFNSRTADVRDECRSPRDVGAAAARQVDLAHAAASARIPRAATSRRCARPRPSDGRRGPRVISHSRVLGVDTRPSALGIGADGKPPRRVLAGRPRCDRRTMVSSRRAQPSREPHVAPATPRRTDAPRRDRRRAGAPPPRHRPRTAATGSRGTRRNPNTW